MAQPTRFVPGYDYSDHSTNFPTTPQPGTELDGDFAALKETTDEICDNLELIQRDDGLLANETVGRDQLKPEVVAGINTPTGWLTATAYTVRDSVFKDDAWYWCKVSHTSGVFATDLAADKWELINDFTEVLQASEADLAAVETDLAAVETDLSAVETDRTAVEAAASDAAAVEADLASVESDFAAVEADASAVESDLAATEGDATATASDKTATEADLLATEADLGAVETDLAATEADIITTAADKTATEADAVTTGADKTATESDLGAVETDLEAVESDLAAVEGAVVDAEAVEADAAAVESDLIAVEAALGSLSLPTPVSNRYGAFIVQNDADDGFEVLTDQGEAGEVLTSNGADALPSFQALSAGGPDWQVALSVRAATTANINLSSALENGDSLDGLTLATGDRVLVKNQSTGSQNGIYVVQASGAAVRATDFDADADIRNTLVMVTAGITNASTLWYLETASGTIGSTSLVFSNAANFRFMRFADSPGMDAASVSGEGSLAIGGESVAAGTNTIAIGTQANSGAVPGNECISIGYLSTVGTGNLGAISIGGQTSTGSGGLADYSVGLGHGASCQADATIAIGRIAYASGVGAIGLGYRSVAGGTFAVAVGYYSDASGAASIAIGGALDDGDSANATGAYAVAIGAGAQATGAAAIAIGGDSAASTTANATGAIAIGTDQGGNRATTAHQYSIAIGDGVQAGDTGVSNGIGIGYNIISNHQGSVMFGEKTRSRNHASFGYSYNSISAAGDSQWVRHLLKGSTSASTPTEIFCGLVSGSRISIPSDATFLFRAYIVARRTDADNESAGYVLTGVIDNNAGTTALVGSVTADYTNEDTAAWAVALTADNTNDALVLTVTGENAKTIYWVAMIETIEVKG